jgi:hypothetical protein
MQSGNVLKAVANDSQTPVFKVYSVRASFLFIILNRRGSATTLPLTHS